MEEGTAHQLIHEELIWFTGSDKTKDGLNLRRMLLRLFQYVLFMRKVGYTKITAKPDKLAYRKYQIGQIK